MTKPDPKKFHKLYGTKKVKMVYDKKDYVDYIIMNILTAAVMYACFASDFVASRVDTVLPGAGMMMALLSVGYCAQMILLFPKRHGGVKLQAPIMIKRPMEVVHSVIYHLTNVKPMWYVAVGLLLLENYVISITPTWPHKVELMHEIAVYGFFLHFILLMLYRTFILIGHLQKTAHIREVLMQSNWRGQITRQPNMALEVWHAYCTGMMTHIALLAPWYVVIALSNFSLVLMPVVVILNIVVQFRFLKDMNNWYYREHWLGHNSEFEFVYLHGPHHDAIPSGLVGVAGTGFLEGFVRNAIGFPAPFFNPILSFLFHTQLVYEDINLHQYIPGMFPKVDRGFENVSQHSSHHYGKMEPLGVGLKLDQPSCPERVEKAYKMLPYEFNNSAMLDEQLTDFKWDNPQHRWYLSMIDKYQGSDGNDAEPIAAADTKPNASAESKKETEESA